MTYPGTEKIHEVRRSQTVMMERAVSYLESFGEADGFDPDSDHQIVAVTQTQPLQEITGLIVLRFPMVRDDWLEVEHLRTAEYHQELIAWASHTAHMIGRSALHVVATRPRDIAVFTQHGFVQNGSESSLLLPVSDRRVG